MATKKFMIAPLTTGTQNNVTPFLIPDDAWETMYNTHINNGRVESRLGGDAMNTTVAGNVEQLYSRVGMSLGTTDAAGLWGAVNGVRTYGTNIGPGVLAKRKIGMLVSVGD